MWAARSMAFPASSVAVMMRARVLVNSSTMMSGDATFPARGCVFLMGFSAG